MKVFQIEENTPAVAIFLMDDAPRNIRTKRAWSFFETITDPIAYKNGRRAEAALDFRNIRPRVFEGPTTLATSPAIANKINEYAKSGHYVFQNEALDWVLVVHEKFVKVTT